jgi:hypothetical protein
MAPTVDDLFGGAATDSQLQAAAGDKICRARVLHHVMGILIPHVDHSGTDFNSSRPGSDCCEEWEWGCELPRKMVNTEICSIHAETLSLYSEVDRLQEHISR